MCWAAVSKGLGSRSQSRARGGLWDSWTVWGFVAVFSVSLGAATVRPQSAALVTANLMGHHQSKGAPHDSIRYVFGFCSSVVEVDFFFSLIWSGWRGDWAL